MGIFHWIFGKHPLRPPDPHRAISVALLPQWQAEIALEELYQAGIEATAADDNTSYLATGFIDAMTHIYVVETDAHQARGIIDEFLSRPQPAHLLRPATADEEPLLRELLYHAIYVATGDAPPAPEAVDQPELKRYFAGFGSRAGDVGWVAETPAAEQIGAVWLRRFPAEAAGYGSISEDIPELSIAVLPPHRNQGAGSALLVAILEGADAVSLSVDARNPAVGLYERFGFETVGSSGDSLTMLYRR